MKVAEPHGSFNALSIENFHCFKIVYFCVYFLLNGPTKSLIWPFVKYKSKSVKLLEFCDIDILTL